MGSAGADVTAWMSGLAIKAIGENIYEVAKGEEKLREELFMSIAAPPKGPEQDVGAGRRVTAGEIQPLADGHRQESGNQQKRYDAFLGGAIKAVDGQSKKLDAARKKLNDEEQLEKLRPARDSRREFRRQGIEPGHPVRSWLREQPGEVR